MHASEIHHPHYRVKRDTWARMFFVGECRVCAPGTTRYRSGKGTPLSCEKAVIAHLKDKHDIEAT